MDDLERLDEWVKENVPLVDEIVPKPNVLCVPELSSEEIDDLRRQVDLSYLDPEYTIMTHPPVEWEKLRMVGRLESESAVDVAIRLMRTAVEKGAGND